MNYLIQEKRYVRILHNITDGINKLILYPNCKRRIGRIMKIIRYPPIADAIRYRIHGFDQRLNTMIFNVCPIKPTINIIIHQYRVNMIDIVFIAFNAIIEASVIFEEDIFPNEMTIFVSNDVDYNKKNVINTIHLA